MIGMAYHLKDTKQFAPTSVSIIGEKEASNTMVVQINVRFP